MVVQEEKSWIAKVIRMYPLGVVNGSIHPKVN